MSIWKKRRFQRVVALILVVASLLSHLEMGITAEANTEKSVYCNQIDHEHTEECYAAPVADGSDSSEELVEEEETPAVPELSQYEKLVEAETLKDIFDLMMSDTEATRALAVEELQAVKDHTEETYAALEDPADDDQEYYEMIVETLEMLMSEEEPENPIATLEEPIAANTIYFDLSLGSVKISSSSYSGKVYRKDGNEYTEIDVTGTHSTSNIYYIFQSNAAAGKYGYVTSDNKVQLPDYDEIANWGESIKENYDPSNVSSLWETAATATGRAATGNYVQVTSGSRYNVVIDDIWSNYMDKSNDSKRATGSICFDAQSSGHMTFTFKGNNRLNNFFYTNHTATNASLKIGGAEDADSLTIIDTTQSSWVAAIGASDNPENVEYLTLSKGYIYAGATASNLNVTAIGAGANGRGGITITGGVVTAVASGNGTAIGGGNGGSANGGYADVTISGGEVYAYVRGFGTAIGGGSANTGAAGEGSVRITGGEVTVGKTGAGLTIGGGRKQNGVENTSSKILISGNATVNGMRADGLSTTTFYGENNVPNALYTSGSNQTIPWNLAGNNEYYVSADGNVLWTGTTTGATTTYYLKKFDPTDTVYFDLALSSVKIVDDTYSGIVYLKDAYDNYAKMTVSGEHRNDLSYYVFQSSGDNKGYMIISNGAITGVEKPHYEASTVDEKNWGDSIKERTDVRQVASDWDSLAVENGRTPTSNFVSVNGSGNYSVTIDEIWSTKNDLDPLRQTGGVAFIPVEAGTMTLTFIGNNRLSNLYCGSSHAGSSMSIGGKTQFDSLTVIANEDGGNKYNSVIGSSDHGYEIKQTVENMSLTGGYIYAGATKNDYCAAIGGGGNGGATIHISGGVVTAVSTGNAAAIGGGYTGNVTTGKAEISIDGDAQVYAYHLGGKGTAIGGGGSDGTSSGCYAGEAEITIGGSANVYAENANGIAIGGGTCSKKSGNASITITTGSVVAENKSGGRSIGAGFGGTTVIDIIPGSKDEFVTANYTDLTRTEYIIVGVSELVHYRSSDVDSVIPDVPQREGYLAGWTETTQDGGTVHFCNYYKAEDSNSIYFDLSLGYVRIDGVIYDGMIYDQASGEVIRLYGKHTDGKKYHVYQSTGSNRASCGLAPDGRVIVPSYGALTVNGKTWAQYITNNSSVEDVVDAWINNAPASDRERTMNRIIFSGNGNYDLTIYDLWLGFELEPDYAGGSNGRGYGEYTEQGGIVYMPSESSKMSLNFVGDNRIDNILYRCTSHEHALAIRGKEKEDTLTVAATLPGTNWWCSAIGNDDAREHVYNLSFEKGTIFAGTTRYDNATAIGGGGNGYGQVTISGDDTVVTAVASTTGVAIGGGIGQSSAGGTGEVIIRGGEVYAYNHGICLEVDNEFWAVPSVAIGGGSSVKSNGSNGYVYITGGNVYAQSIFGAAIGSGGSAQKSAGSATIQILGGTVVAISKAGKIFGAKQHETFIASSNKQLDHTNDSMEKGAGVSIGGGTAYLNGGYANLTISGENTVVKTGSIGGGHCTGNGPLGYAKVTISGGSIQGQIIMQETGKEGDFCSFTATGGKLDNQYHKNDPEKDGTFSDGVYTYYFVEKNGGAVCMKDSHGVTDISESAVIQNCYGVNGGAVYMTGGTFTMTGGTIQNCSADEDGGAVYLGGGTVNYKGGLLQSNKSGKNGGGIAVNNGTIIMSGGTVSGNEAQNGHGGGMYVSAPAGKAVAVKVYSGELSNNIASGSGGAVAVNGLEQSKITVQVGVNKNHYTGENGALKYGFTHDGTYTHLSCPVVRENQATKSGGAFYINAAQDSTTNLNIYCSVDDGNHVAEDIDTVQDNKELSSYMMVEGGNVIISTSEANKLDDKGNSSLSDNKHGFMQVKGTVHVVSGQLEIFGAMDNPSFADYLTIDLQKEGDKYADHRVSTSKIKISYHENFKDADGRPDSTQTAFDIETGTKREIETALYSHDGYELVGWNTDPNAEKGKTETGWYTPGKEYTFYNENDMNKPEPGDGIQIGDLTLYAIWKINGYTIAFDSGVADGDKWWGSVTSITCEYTETVELPKNGEDDETGFVYPGYVFTGWKLDNKIYQPGEKVRMLTDKNADVVTFVAQWAECKHEGECIYTVNDTKDVITKTCKVCQYSATAKLTASDAVYDAKSHPAVLEKSDPEFLKDLVITYTGKIIDKDGNMVSPERNVSTPEKCTNAGKYTVTVTGGTVEVKTTFTIYKADQEAPDVIPTYVRPTAAPFILKVNQIAKEKRLSNVPVQVNEAKPAAEYIARYYEGTTAIDKVYPGDSTDNPREHELKAALTTYSVYVRYAETDNYNASPMISANAAFFFSDTLILDITADKGIDYSTSHTEGTQEGSNIQETSLILNVKLEEGYYLLNQNNDDDKFDVAITGDGAPYINYSIETGLGTNQVTYQFVATDMPTSGKYEAHLHIGTTKKSAAIQSTAKEKEHFNNFEGSASVTIARDSAFTVQYTVKGYYVSDYGVPVLSFDKTLPQGTTIILRDRTDESYWYYKFDQAASSVALVAASGAPATFKKMGMTTDVPYSISDGDMKLQFIVDFSRAISYPTGEDLVCTLNIAKNPANTNSNVKSLSSGVTVTLSDVSYAMTAPTGQSLNVNVGASVAASKYENRDLALVLEPVTGTVLPVDAGIKMKVGAVEVTYRPNQNGKIIIPIGDFQTITQDIQFELESRMFPLEEKTYRLNATLYLSNSDAEDASLNGDVLVSNVGLSFKGQSVANGIAVKEDTDKRIYTVGEKITVSVRTKPAELQRGYAVIVQLEEEQNGLYINTALPYENSGSEYTFDLSGVRDGNYRIVAMLSYNDLVVSESKYYIIVQPSE